ncbi:MAG: translation elongation factor 4 [Thermodesulfovibrionales bacterium]|nr:translation elongation factor 4 [Thermodesulfovibrionales bacterium]
MEKKPIPAERDTSPKRIRNFSIIAHIDHGKSTLADRLLERTGAVSRSKMTEQMLDSMDLERERGITIKAHAVRLDYRAEDGSDYILNLIDTPGHVDFSYEVSRSLASCEGALLLVDAAQGLQAQSFANAYLAIDNNLEIIPVINKIDLPSADPERVREQIENALPLKGSEILLTSAKEGTGINEIIEAIVARIPPPSGRDENPLKALIFDSWFDNYRGVVVLVRVFDGIVRPGMKIRLMGSGKELDVAEVGYFRPKISPAEALSSGEVGYVIAGIKTITDTKVGDTITNAARPASEPCPGYKEVKPMVFCGLYPTETGQFEALKDAVEKLRLNDSSFSYEPETSLALGFGFRCGFLGLLHMDIIRERLEREFRLSLICTPPTVTYKVTGHKGDVSLIHNPNLLSGKTISVEEPYVRAVIFVPQTFVGPVLDLCQQKRGAQTEFNFISADRIMLAYELPLGEILWDFFDKLKSVTKGYASLDYEFIGWREGDVVRLDILLNGEPVDALSLIVHRDKAYHKGRQVVDKLREVIPRQLFEVVIQAAIGGKVIARQSVKAMRKDVIAKCYGGDITRKRKLLEKQREGKKRMKQVGRIDIPQEAFLAALSTEG